MHKLFSKSMKKKVQKGGGFPLKSVVVYMAKRRDGAKTALSPFFMIIPRGWGRGSLAKWWLAL